MLHQGIKLNSYRILQFILHTKKTGPLFWTSWWPENTTHTHIFHENYTHQLTDWHDGQTECFTFNNPKRLYFCSAFYINLWTYIKLSLFFNKLINKESKNRESKYYYSHWPVNIMIFFIIILCKVKGSWDQVAWTHCSSWSQNQGHPDSSPDRIVTDAPSYRLTHNSCPISCFFK